MINNKILITILEQHKLTDEQSEELQKVIYCLDDGPLQELSKSETRSIKIAFGKDNKAVLLKDDYCIYCANEKVLEDAKDAISKILHPKKPIPNDGIHIRYALCYDCPSCGKAFSGTGIADYCYHCGQKLDWSDNNDV